jgi:uncharacterized protein with PhoU and TrkA domain
MGEVGYEPVSVKTVLAEMKDTAELLVDLSYSAVLAGDREVAAEVLALEERMDLLQMRARISLLLAARSPEDAEELAPVLGVVGAAEKISNAAGDVAKVLLEEVGLPESMRAVLPAAVETLVRARLAADSAMVDRTLGELDLETTTGVRVIAVHRPGADDGPAGGDWLLDPGPETRLHASDVLLLRGPGAGGAADGLPAVYERATGESYDPPTPAGPPLPDLDRAVDAVVSMKEAAELAVDLAYGAVLFDSPAVAEEVTALEAEVDALQTRLEAWTLRAAAEVEDPVSLRGLVHLAAANEVISDAALELSEGVLRGLSAHPVVAEAVDESEEVFVRLTVAPGAALDGTTLGDREVGTATGTRVVAVRRGDERDGEGDTEWVISPGPTTRLAAGDVVLASGTRRGAERLAEMAGDPREFEA